MDEVYARTGESTDGKTDSATSCVILELNRQSRPPTKLEIVESAFFTSWGWRSSIVDISLHRNSHAKDVISIAFSYLALATGHGDVDETTGVDDPLAGTALRSLGLLLLVDLGSGGLDLTGTSEAEKKGQNLKLGDIFDGGVVRRRVTYDPWTYNGVKSVISISPCEKEGVDDLFTYLTHIDCIWRMNGERVSLGSVDGVVADDAD
ncbi:unnamed protein product [Aspergillus oryzae]|nr:unnamed protein product [Aspergillus oryzae]GMF84818.1 unnamed protein product [Aspergillus oryzae]GMG03482.1 unnamed protein product [Aspergillus oryzae]